MSLKAFHILFVTVSTLMCVGLGVWGTQRIQAAQSALPLAMAVVGYAGAAALVVYGIVVFKKLRVL